MRRSTPSIISAGVKEFIRPAGPARRNCYTHVTHLKQCRNRRGGGRLHVDKWPWLYKSLTYLIATAAYCSDPGHQTSSRLGRGWSLGIHDTHWRINPTKMAMINDVEYAPSYPCHLALADTLSYALQAIRLSALRYTDDPLSPRLITLDPAFALNPYINASGLADIDRWPEIKRALDSPPPEYPSSYESARMIRAGRMSRDRSRDGRGSGSNSQAPSRGGGLNYTQTIMGPYRSGGAGMRVTGRRTVGEGRGVKDSRASSSEALAPVVCGLHPS